MDLKEALVGYDKIDSLKDFESVEAMADSLLEIRAKMATTHRGPAKDAPNEDIVRHLREVAGVKSATDFRIDHVEDEKLRSVMDKARDAAFETGVTPDGWARLTTIIAENDRTNQKAVDEARSSELSALLASKGTEADGFKNSAEQALSKLVETHPSLEGKFSAENPDHLILLGEIAGLTKSEGTLPAGGGSTTTTNSEAGFEKIYAAMQDPAASYQGHEPEKILAKKASVRTYESLFREHVGEERTEEFQAWMRKRQERR